MTTFPLAPLAVLGIALMGTLVTGVFFFALGITAGKKMGPTRTVETYGGTDVPF